MPLIETKVEGAVGTIILAYPPHYPRHPEKRNALSRRLIDSIIKSLASFRQEGVRVAVLRA